ncbi:hypothetical protein MIV001R [Invertebrate iridescent virus 3]|uniref:Uncharacterized protein 001R n=1 Tax=Invertebrate iridescent virus 3 TaxID=345201 RepID=VF395_IIV3|nr:hypothetical protein MIV001R [Invertebrate iridescent virus 3]Q197F9.1 RecName: Full=Uncharacterized protein 001R [Invertebrate iridescent virus 3]ABF82031.1 hypothetical protein MIV001R [Invertebrate iridescent virus 3]
MNSRHVGQDSTTRDWYRDPKTIAWISDAVMEKTLGVARRPIRVSDKVILNVLDSFLQNNRPAIGHGCGVTNNPSYVTCDKYCPSLAPIETNPVVVRVVEFISQYIRDEYSFQEAGKQWSAWPSDRIQKHSQIKVRDRRPIPFQFNMNF